MLHFLFDWIHDASDYLLGKGWNEVWVKFLSGLFILAILAVAAVAVYWLVRVLLKKSLEFFYRRHRKAWMSVLLKRQTFNYVCYFLICAFYANTVSYMFQELPTWIPFMSKVFKLVSLYFALRGLNSILWTVFDLRQEATSDKTVALKGLLQFVSILVYFIGGIIAVSILANKSPLVFIGGLSAASAVLMLVFKDSITGLVAGVQISSNDMVRLGDWITMPSLGVDGNIIDISLTTVKVQNFDLTILTIPTSALITQSVQNWRGLQMAGSRRIQRNLYVDLSSIRFCDEALVEKSSRLPLLRAYLDKQKESRRDAKGLFAMTNVEVFMKYVEAYLQAHPRIRHEESFTLLVRQLPAEDVGMPIQIYCFANTPDWVAYEAIATEVIAHVVAVMPFFGLKAYQRSAQVDNREFQPEALPGLEE